MKELIERLRDSARWQLIEGNGDDEIHRGLVEAADAIERLTAEHDALRADAERYRWIEKNTDCSFGLATFQLDVPHPSCSLSYCIDAAIAGEKT